MLSIARALMARPKLLLLDEPSLGLAPIIVKQIFDAIRELNRTKGLTVFLVEQNAFGALKLASRGYVMVTRQHHHERDRQGTSGQSGSARRLSRRRTSLRSKTMFLDILTGHIFENRAYGEIVFLILCAAGGWMIGKSIATDWKSIGSLIGFTLLLGLGARFLHFALYEAVFVSPCAI